MRGDVLALVVFAPADARAQIRHHLDQALDALPASTNAAPDDRSGDGSNGARLQEPAWLADRRACVVGNFWSVGVAIVIR